MHAQGDLVRLWEFLKTKRCPTSDHVLHSGFLAVEFSRDEGDFRRAYRNNLYDEGMPFNEFDVTQSVDEAIRILESAICFRKYHLTCAANRDAGSNSALCVHYDTQHGVRSVALLGVNYLRNASVWDSGCTGVAGRHHRTTDQ